MNKVIANGKIQVFTELAATFFGLSNTDKVREIEYLARNIIEMIIYPDRAFINETSRKQLSKTVKTLSNGSVKVLSVGFISIKGDEDPFALSVEFENQNRERLKVSGTDDLLTARFELDLPAQQVNGGYGTLESNQYSKILSSYS